TSHAIAAIYVWLGSSMGANIIVRRLEAMTLDIPTEYYQAMAGCAKAWVSFKQEVETLLPELGLDNESFVQNAVQDANAWFEFLISLGKRTAPNDTPYHEANV
ncbi:MAG: biliverdin-producing heme oxygenase, partial [Alteromonas sp.]|nr:biliverdin-producing heme oxygenase [Alteromonas sp.]